MSWLAIFMLFMIVAGLAVSFTIVVWFGVDAAPQWLIYASFPVMALAGGAAINMILFGVPK